MGTGIYFIREALVCQFLTHMEGLTWDLEDEPSVCGDKNCQL